MMSGQANAAAMSKKRNKGSRGGHFLELGSGEDLSQTVESHPKVSRPSQSSSDWRAEPKEMPITKTLDPPTLEVFVGRLPFEASEEEIRNFFHEELNVNCIGIHLFMREDGQNKGYGYFKFSCQEDVDSVVAKNGIQFQGRTLVMERKKGNADKPELRQPLFKSGMKRGRGRGGGGDGPNSGRGGGAAYDGQNGGEGNSRRGGGGGDYDG
eukprot:PhF_6_TR6118/c1_g1_i2/m.9034